MLSQADEFIKQILEEKFKLEKSGRKPRIVLIGTKEFDMVEKNWVESIRELPWGDSLMYDIEMKDTQNTFLGDGSLFDLWVIKVDTIEGFKVY